MAKLRRRLLVVDRVTDFSVLRRVTPYRPEFGWFRGNCVDRYYIENFLSRHSHDVRGRVVEIGENYYMARIGGDRITHADVLDIVPRPGVTILADLADAPSVPDNSFDCFLCPQTLMCVYDLRAAANTIYRTLAPGGVALITLSGISQIPPLSMMRGAEDYWRFTGASAQRIFADAFGEENVAVQTWGNVLTATAFLHGLVAEELTPEEFDYHDPDYPMVVTVRAAKPVSPRTSARA